MKRLLIAAALLVLSGTALAQTKYPQPVGYAYGELGWQNLEVKNDRVPNYGPKIDTISGIFGYKFHPFVSIELLLATGLSSNNSTIAGGPASTKIDQMYGLMLRPSYQFNEHMEGFARVGYGRSKITLNAPNFSSSGGDNSYIWGLGANYYFNRNVYGQLSYTSFFDKDGMTSKGFGLSVGYKF